MWPLSHRLHQLLPLFLALPLLVGWSSPGRAAIPPAPQILEVKGLGPLLLAGPDRASAIKSYVDSAVRRRIFPGQGRILRQVAGERLRLDQALSLEELQRAGKPIIGVQLNGLEDLTGGRLAAESSGALPVARAIRRAGGIPLFLPPGGELAAIATLLGSIDHLVLLGGDDVHPRLYGQRVTHAQDCLLGRDRYEVALVRQAMAQGIGIDGICRGMQLLNVAAGGTLYQDIHADGATGKAHSNPGFILIRHEVRLAEGCRTAELLGAERLVVRGRHHQAVCRPGEGMAVVGRSIDGLPELLEGRGGAVRGYQFHPERSRGRASRAIFADIVARAAVHLQEGGVR